MGHLERIERLANESDYVLTGYICDTYTTIAGSANAPLCILRGLLIAVYPHFAPALYDNLGTDIAGSVLAAIIVLSTLRLGSMVSE